MTNWVSVIIWRLITGQWSWHHTCCSHKVCHNPRGLAISIGWIPTSGTSCTVCKDTLDHVHCSAFTPESLIPGRTDVLIRFEYAIRPGINVPGLYVCTYTLDRVRYSPCRSHCSLRAPAALVGWDPSDHQHGLPGSEASQIHDLRAIHVHNRCSAHVIIHAYMKIYT